MMKMIFFKIIFFNPTKTLRFLSLKNISNSNFKPSKIFFYQISHTKFPKSKTKLFRCKKITSAIVNIILS